MKILIFDMIDYNKFIVFNIYSIDTLLLYTPSKKANFGRKTLKSI